jgi:hypothetical protein
MNRLFDVITVSGSDARAFLQGQLTQDVDRLAATPSVLSAWCNPKGRVITVMRLLDMGDGDDEIGLVVPAGLSGSLVRRLLMFRFRARVEVEAPGFEWEAVAVSDDADLAELETLDLLPAGNGSLVSRRRKLVAIDLAIEPRCVEVYGAVAAFRNAGLGLRRTLTETEWQLALINAGIPLILAATSEQYTPHMLNLDRLGAVSFNKGCYTGQEVVARTQHLGKSKRRLMHFRTDGNAVAVGEKLRHEERDVGEVVNAIGEDLLAVVPVELHGLTLLANGVRAAPVPLPYELPPVEAP